MRGLFGGENFVGGAGGTGLEVSSASAVWLSFVEIRGGMGTPGGSAIVNTSAVPVELIAATTAAGGSFGVGSLPVLVRPATVNPNLLALRWNEPPYRRGSLRPGQPWSVLLRGPASAPVALAFSFGPLGTAATWTRQPAMSLGDFVTMVALATNGSGQVIYPSSVPNTTALFGAGLWAQAIGGPAFPFEASPHAGAVVRPFWPGMAWPRNRPGRLLASIRCATYPRATQCPPRAELALARRLRPLAAHRR